jgi:putative MATE family efflux protein
VSLDRTAPIFRLGAPMIAFFLVQNFANLACLALLGRLGDATLAGVGAANAIVGAVMALLFGFDTAVQALNARATGAGSRSGPGEVLADALSASIPLGVTIAAGVWAFSPAILAAMLPDPAAVRAGASFARAAAPSLVFLAVTTPMNASWIGSGRPAVAFLVTAVTAPTQVFFTWLLVFGAGPIAAEGAAGSGLAASLDTLVGLALQIALALRLRLVPRWVAPSMAGLARVAAVGWPVSAQQSLLQLGLIIVFAIVARLGTAQAAVINVLLSLTLIPIQISTGFGVAAATLVGQTLGRGEADEARRWGWRAAGVGALLTAPLGLAAAIAPEPLLGLFLHDPATLALAVLPARIVALAVGLDSAERVLSFAFRGAGATKIAAGVPFGSFWLIQLPLMAWVALGLRQGVTGLVLVNTGVIVVDATLMAWLWSGGVWTRATARVLATAARLPADVARIAVLGGGGVGKSTLARQLGAALGLPVVHLDRVVHGPGWARLADATVRDHLAPMLAGDRWVVDGTYQAASELSLPRADIVLWIDQPTWLRLYRSWRKTRDHRGRPRADRPDGCEEVFGWPYVVSILSFGRWSKPMERQIGALARGPVVRLRGDRGIAELLAQIRAS